MHRVEQKQEPVDEMIILCRIILGNAENGRSEGGIVSRRRRLT